MRFLISCFIVFFIISTSNATVRLFNLSTLAVGEHPEYPSNEQPLKYNWWDTVVFTNLEENTEYEFDVYAYDSEVNREKQVIRDQSKIYAVLSEIQVSGRKSNYSEFLYIEAKGTKIKIKTLPQRSHNNGLSISFRMVNLSRTPRYLSAESTRQK